jgi:uncharacterized membrane protein YfcA
MSGLEIYSISLNLVSLHGLILVVGGFIAGCLAGLSGIGGGLILVPLMVGVGIAPVEAIGTSTFAKFMISAAGSWQNWRMGNLDFQRVAVLGLPSLLTAQLGAYIASKLPSYLLLSSVGCLLLANIYLINFRRRNQVQQTTQQQPKSLFFWRAIAGSAAGLLPGLFGVGAGIILLPLQILLFRETMQIAVQTTLGVVFLSSMSACIGHTLSGNVLFLDGLVLGITGAIGAYLGTNLLQKLPDIVVSLSANTVLIIAVIYIVWYTKFASPS